MRKSRFSFPVHRLPLAVHRSPFTVYPLPFTPASVRNVMSALEEMGFIASPHPSAGRVPTARGYRFFVDTLLTIKPLDTVEISQLEGQLHARSEEHTSELQS